MNPAEPFSYSLAQVSVLTGISKRSLADGCRAGKIPHTKYGQTTVMTPEHIQEFLVRYERRSDVHPEAADPDVVRYMRQRDRSAA